jgi:hypothetical protein
VTTEDGLRRAAYRQGKRLVKSRTRDPRALEYGKWFLLGPGESVPAYTGRPREGAMTLGEVEEKLTFPLAQEPLGRWFARTWLQDDGVYGTAVASWATVQHRHSEERMTIFKADDGLFYGVELNCMLGDAIENDFFYYQREEMIWCPRFEQRPVTELKWVPVA